MMRIKLMNNMYFIDTCWLINLYEKTSKKHEETKNKFTLLLEEQGQSDTYPFFINKFTYIEFLRETHIAEGQKFSEQLELLDTFELVEISKTVIKKSIDLYRFAKYGGCKQITISQEKWRIIDFIHFICCKENNLTMLSYDKDMKLLETIYISYLEHLSKNQP